MSGNVSAQPLSGAAVLLVGPGWLGSAIADSLLERGARLWTLRRSPAVSMTRKNAGDPIAAVPPSHPNRHDLTGDIRTAATDHTLLSRLPSQIDFLVLCVAPSRELGDTHENSYPAATRGALALALAIGARALLYTSSTGVYGRTDGSVVSDGSPVHTSDTRQQALVDAERTLLDNSSLSTRGTAPGVIVLRVAGLYGPGRDPARRFGDASVLADGGTSWSNFAWRDDAASAVVHLLADSKFQRGAHVFNCADGHPMQAREIAAALGVHEPRDGTLSASTTRAVAPSSRGAARSNQRIMVDGLLATGWTPSMPTVLHGLARLGHVVHMRNDVPNSTPSARPV